jgi:hypothetical protein
VVTALLVMPPLLPADMATRVPVRRAASTMAVCPKDLEANNRSRSTDLDTGSR